MKAAIVSTKRKWDAHTREWANYHLSLGFSSIYLYIDCESSSFECKPSSVNLTFCTPSYWLCNFQEPQFSKMLKVIHSTIGTTRWASPDSLTCRQILNANAAMEQARLDGIDWLLHIDGDELFWCPQISAYDHFCGMDYAEIDHITYCNHEAILFHNSSTASPGVTFFKINLFCLPESHRALLDRILLGKPYFTSYANGKSAARVKSARGVGGAHSFLPRDTNRWHSALVTAQAILHRPYDSISHFMVKHFQLADFSDNLLDQQWTPPGVYGKARDLVQASDANGLIELFNRTVLLDDSEFYDLQQHGFIMSVDTVLPFSS